MEVAGVCGKSSKKLSPDGVRSRELSGKTVWKYRGVLSGRWSLWGVVWYALRRMSGDGMRSLEFLRHRGGVVKGVGACGKVY